MFVRSLLLFSVHALCFAALAAEASPEPGRIPKVYNALISSNQNLEPSKAFPVYQPVLQDPFFSYQPLYYPQPEFRNIFPTLKNGHEQPQAPPAAASENIPITSPPSSEAPTADPAQEDAKNDGENKVTPGPPPPPPSTESPIPLNEFGLPPQVLPLGRIDPAYNGFTQVGPLSYSFPGFRYYDPFYDPFSLNPYLNLPSLYRPLPNGLGAGVPLPVSPKGGAGVPVPGPIPEAPLPSPPEQGVSTPPPEPDNLSILNYASKDPAIPNVPPPPLPEGGLKTNSE